MAGRYKTELRKVSAIPKGAAFIPHTLELMTSDAWRGRSINCARFIEFLEIEHMRHGGSENGSLLAPWDQLVAFGMGRRFIRAAINEAVARGLAEEVAGVRRTFNSVTATRYRLTYLPEAVNRPGARYFNEPTNEWRRFKTLPDESRNSGHEGELQRCTLVNSDSAPSCTQDDAETAENCDPPKVHEGAPLYISWPHTENPAGNIPFANAAGTAHPTNAGRQHDPEPASQADLAGNSTDFEVDPKKIGVAAKARLAAEGLRLRHLAAAVGVSPSQLSNRIVGRYGLNPAAEARLRAYAAGDLHLDREAA